MKQIKCKVWDKKNQKTVEVRAIDFAENGSLLSVDVSEGRNLPLYALHVNEIDKLEFTETYEND